MHNLGTNAEMLCKFWAISDCKHEQVDHCYALEGAGVECTMEKQGNIVIEHYKLFLNDLLILENRVLFRRVKMFLENPCTIYEGIQRGNICCAKSCGTCGGKDCGIRPGGYSKCCTSQIPLNQVCGPQQNAPCHLQNGKIICCNQNKPFVLTGLYNSQKESKFLF